MISPLEQICELEVVIRELYKIDSKLMAGQIIPAYRENRKLIAALEKIKQDIIKESKNNKSSLTSVSRSLSLENLNVETLEKGFGEAMDTEENQTRKL